MNQNQFTWDRPLQGSDLEALADSIRQEFQEDGDRRCWRVRDIRAEAQANAPAIRAVRAAGARKLWVAKSQKNEILYTQYRRGENRIYREQERANQWTSPLTDSEYDICWSDNLGVRGAPYDPPPTELLETKVRLRTGEGITRSDGSISLRFYSLLGDSITGAIDTISSEFVNRFYIFAVYQTTGVPDAKWRKIVPEIGEYTLSLRPYQAPDVNPPHGAPWLVQENGTINLHNKKIIRQVFGRGGCFHTIGLHERDGEMEIKFDVANRNCGSWSFALYSLNQVKFQSDEWTLETWLP